MSNSRLLPPGGFGVNYRSTIGLLAAGAAVALSTGCASTMNQSSAQALLPEIDVVQVKENSDEALKLAQEAKLDIEVINTKLTELDNRLVLLSEEVSAVSIAKIEELENRLSLLIEAYKDLQARMNAHEVSVHGKPKAAGPAPSFAPSAGAPLLNTSSEYDDYHGALRVFNSRNYAQALKLFNETAQKYPQGSYADNCQYWIGETHYALGEYAAAVAAFGRVLKFENSSKADDAQLKIGLSYLKMGQAGTAKAELKKLIDRYPASEYVPRAQKYLADMK